MFILVKVKNGVGFELIWGNITWLTKNWSGMGFGKGQKLRRRDWNYGFI